MNIFTINNFEKVSFDNYDLDLRQKDVVGGQISIEQIDSIKNFPNAKSIVISGLQDKTLDYFVEKYASQFSIISFWKNKKITTLKPLEKLHSLEYLIFFYNKKVQELWNLENNKKLKGLCIYNFTNLHSIDGIEKCQSLKYFSFGSEAGNHDKNVYLESLKNLKATNIEYFGWWGNSLLDNNYKILSETKINCLDMNPHRFTLEELTNLISYFPKSLKGTVTVPYSTLEVQENGIITEYIIPCKGVKTFIKGRDDSKFEKYIEKFNQMLSEKRRRNKNERIK